ncbi:MAG: mechanosensitive ion channel [Armatimonadota bacterium]|nr:mechanosensitive ion channel [Armatimonadota bacterium]MDR7403686.1 mechanosensitive ion channel [Armatimonadota bacterium]
MTAEGLHRLREALRGFETALTVTAIVLGAAVAMRLAPALIRCALAARTGVLDEPRRRTLQSLLESLARYLLAFIALVMVLRELGVDATAILASAGVVGIAVGLGAQTLIRDIIAGVLLISEDLLHVGDVITVDSRTGTVERIGLRTTQFRTDDGEVWTIPNGRLEIFGNRGPRRGGSP